MKANEEAGEGRQELGKRGHRTPDAAAGGRGAAEDSNALREAHPNARRQIARMLKRRRDWVRQMRRGQWTKVTC